MYIDGKVIASRIYAELSPHVAACDVPPRLGILTCAPTFETQKYLALKEKKAREVGIHTNICSLDGESTTSMVLAALAELIRGADGVVVQLPLPAHIDTEAILRTIPPSHDVDALNPSTTQVLAPVVGAIREIFRVHEIPIFERHITIVGSGRLVGLPASQWCMEQGGAVSVVTKDTIDIGYYTKNADIIITGAGVPGLITPDMVKAGVVILDAGTSEDGGELRGDVDPRVAEKASFFTPVPGGIGPITIAVLLRNVVELKKSLHTVV